MNEMTRYRPRYEVFDPSVSKVHMDKSSKRFDELKGMSFDHVEKVNKKSLIKLAEMAVNLPKERSPPKRVKKTIDSEN
jgi:hypothetical protein